MLWGAIPVQPPLLGRACCTVPKIQFGLPSALPSTHMHSPLWAQCRLQKPCRPQLSCPCLAGTSTSPFLTTPKGVAHQASPEVTKVCAVCTCFGTCVWLWPQTHDQARPPLCGPGHIEPQGKSARRHAHHFAGLAVQRLRRSRAGV